MSQAAPLISVIVPVFNGERFLAEALDCIVPAAPISKIGSMQQRRALDICQSGNPSELEQWFFTCQYS